MAEEKDTKKAKEKRPTALKRDLQNERRRLANRSFQAQVNTAIRSLRDSVAKKDKAATQTQLSNVFSLMDKGVKIGMFKLNKASRTKSRLSAETTI
jgi:small subunit ribosomal protein S20